MKVILINPNSSLISNSWAYRRFFTPIAPLGMAYLAAVLEKNGIEVSIIDQFASKITDCQIIERIKMEKPEVIGFSTLTPVFNDVKRLVKGVRQVDEGIKVVMGNIHATCFPEEILREGIADIIIKGEGEITLLELCQRLARSADLEHLSGISFKKNGNIIHNPQREIINDLDSLPLPAWHLFNLDDYKEVPLAAINKTRALPIIASRGCRFRCYYCSQDKIYNKVRYRNLEKVIEEMDYFNDKLKIKIFGFSDAYFPFDEESGLRFCDLIIKRGLQKRLKWCTETRVDKVTPKLLNAMKEAGVHLIMYGVEVGNKEVLNTLKKGTTLEQARIAIKATKKAGILCQGLFILGLPNETIETCQDTINFAKELDCDIVKFNIAMPYPGSLFFTDYKDILKINNSEKFTSWYDWLGKSEDLVYTPAGMDSMKLKYLQRKAMFEFYARPRIVFRHILKGAISFKNIFYGSIWLVCLFCSELLIRVRYFVNGAYQKKE
ncbi:MAG: radical SAM protein [Candidatus Omnitrophota bacterium]